MVKFSPAMAARGKRKSDLRKIAETRGNAKEIEWMDSQETWKSDIEYYENSLKVDEKPSESVTEVKSKVKK